MKYDPRKGLLIWALLTLGLVLINLQFNRRIFWNWFVILIPVWLLDAIFLIPTICMLCEYLVRILRRSDEFITYSCCLYRFRNISGSADQLIPLCFFLSKIVAQVMICLRAEQLRSVGEIVIGDKYSSPAGGLRNIDEQFNSIVSIYVGKTNRNIDKPMVVDAAPYTERPLVTKPNKMMTFQPNISASTSFGNQSNDTSTDYSRENSALFMSANFSDNTTNKDSADMVKKSADLSLPESKPLLRLLYLAIPIWMSIITALVALTNELFNDGFRKSWILCTANTAALLANERSSELEMQEVKKAKIGGKKRNETSEERL